MQYTTNYSLKKPQYADEADIEIINDNTDDVDTLIHQNRTMIAPAFDNTKAYVTGDPVEYLGALYVFVADKAAGAWDASKVEPTTAAEMGGGGASALADLDDVEITSPANKQTMKYNSTSQKWENGNSDLGDLGDVAITTPTEGQALLYDDQNDEWVNSDLPDASVTKTATGNPIQLTDSASAPLVKCVTAITGYQEGTGTPSPDNVRPITAYTENTISVGGDMGYDTSDFIPHSSGVTKTVESDGILFSANGSATYQDIAIGTNNSLIVPPGTYTIEVDVVSVSDTSAESMFGLRKSNYSFIVPNIDSSSVGHKSLKVTTEESTYISMTLNGSPSSQNAIKIKNFKLINVEQQSTTTYPSAIYRGSEDCVGGSVNCDNPCINLGDLEWTTRYTGNVNKTLSANLPNEYATNNPQIIAEDLTYIQNVGGAAQLSNPDVKAVGIYGYGAVELTRVIYIVAPIDYTPSYKCAYKLATPTTTPVTPTNLPIKSLSGYSHIESSTGDMEIEYITKGEQAIVDLIEKSDHIYSTQEQAVGTWIDGKTMYERTFHFENPTKTTVGGVYAYTNVLSGDYDYFEVVSNVAYESNDDRYYDLPCFRITSSETLYTQYYRDSSGSIQATVFTGDSSWTFADIYLTIRYTKSSSNNRSLSKGGGEQEVKEEPTEETKEEPKEETKEENENNEAER